MSETLESPEVSPSSTSEDVDPTLSLPTGMRARWIVWSERLASVRPRRLSLRVRILLMFAIGALLLSGFLAAVMVVGLGLAITDLFKK